MSSDVGYIVMTNFSRSKIIGIGTLNVKIFDRFVQTLGDIRHIPSLTMNMVALSRLDTSGCAFATRNEFMEVGKDLLVIMTKKTINNLYN